MDAETSQNFEPYEHDEVKPPQDSTVSCPLTPGSVFYSWVHLTNQFAIKTQTQLKYCSVLYQFMITCLVLKFAYATKAVMAGHMHNFVVITELHFGVKQNEYRQVSNKSHLSRQLNCRSLRWSIACRRCSNYIFILGLTHGFNILHKDNCKPRKKQWSLGIRCVLY